MKSSEILREKVQTFWKNNELDLKIDPSDMRTLEWYVEKCIELLPNLYRELEEEKLLPKNATYQGFLQVFEFEFNKQRQIVMFGGL